MAERLLIVKVKRTDQTTAELYGARHRYPDLRLFDLSELATVGIDFEALPIGEERPARFYAYYELSSKTNQRGNPYKDIIALEPVGSPATVASTDNTAILGELRAIRALLRLMAEAQGLQVLPEGDGEQEPDGELEAAFPRYGSGDPLGDKPAEVAAYEEHVKATGRAPQDLEALRQWYKARQDATGPQNGRSATPGPGGA